MLFFQEQLLIIPSHYTQSKNFLKLDANKFPFNNQFSFTQDDQIFILFAKISAYLINISSLPHMFKIINEQVHSLETKLGNQIGFLYCLIG